MLSGLPAVGCNAAGNFLFSGYEAMSERTSNTSLLFLIRVRKNGEPAAYITRQESIGIAPRDGETETRSGVSERSFQVGPSEVKWRHPSRVSVY